MLEFDMPKATDKERYERFKEALEASKIPFGKTFELDINEGYILNLAKKKIDFQTKQMSFGCVANPPQFSYWTKSNGFYVTYKRKLQSFSKKDGFFKDRMPVISEISRAFSVPENYYEILYLEREVQDYAKIKVFSDDEKWRFTFNDCESIRNIKDDGENIKYAVGVILDFCR
ncbi:MAG: hypothetical protein WA139_01415 [Candidatus Aenigmatarchaeota archaeon]